MRQPIEILHDIAQFHPVDGVWLPLDQLLDELWSHGPPPREALPVLFGVFERFPDEDGSGAFWSILHGVESLPHDYASMLEDSHRRVPSFMADIMLRRLAKAGETSQRSH